MRVFDKPVIGVPAQIALLKQRGLRIQNEAKAHRFLEAVSYFRLTPYMRTFQRKEDQDHPFRDGAGFKDLTRLYEFDRRLRLLVIDAIERVEVAVRSRISDHMGPLHGGHWYLNARLFQHTYDHNRHHPRIYPVLCILSHLNRRVSPHSRWDVRLRELMREFPDVDQRAMGFPEHWHQDDFWGFD